MLRDGNDKQGGFQYVVISKSFIEPMTHAKKNKDADAKVRRLSFPSEEKEYPWLPMLLDAYSVVDKGVAKAIESEQAKGRKPACGKGCSNCCKTHRDIPVYPLELVGISWYATEKITNPLREMLAGQLQNHRMQDPCPFLVKKGCSVHPMRPVACRQFNVFRTQCAEGEDAYYTRREDVLLPVKKYVDQAFFIMLPFYGVEKESERIKVVESGSMHKMVRVMQTCNWKSLAEKMRNFDMKNTEKGL